MKLVDLHIHSYYSDGTMSPIEILEDAHNKNVKLLSITDHNELRGTIEAQELSKNFNFDFILGVELDVYYDNVRYHLLAYNFDHKNKQFKDLVSSNKEKLEGINVGLIDYLEKNNLYNVTMEDYNAYKYDRTQGGWKALHYLLYKGITKKLDEGFLMYANYSKDIKKPDFPELIKTLDVIHNAGGVAIIAHPVRTIKHNDIIDLKEMLNKLILAGIDGIECYYPINTIEETELCIELCKENNLIITSGSDCHGKFEHTSIGQLNTNVNLCNIKDFLEK